MRELQSKFRFRNDLITYLKYIKGYFLSADSHVTIRFLKNFLSGEKEVLKTANVMVFNFPYYSELAVEKVFLQVKDDPEIMKYMNFNEDYQEVPHRKYIYGVLGTLWPGYVQELIKHANKARNIKDKDEEANEMIYITEDIFKKLEAESFFSKIKGKALSMLKYRSKPRAKKIKRQFHEISQPVKEFKSKVDDYGRGDRQIIPKEMIQDSSGKRVPPYKEME